MTIKEYQDFCKKGILQPTKEAGEALIFGLGLAGESGEVCDIIKKVNGHGKPLDINHLKEELGDVMWYVANLCSTYNLSLQNVIESNVQKLKKRYEDMYEPKVKLEHKCAKCGNNTFIEKRSGPHIKLVCSKCGAYYKFISKQEKEELPWKTE